MNPFPRKPKRKQAPIVETEHDILRRQAAIAYLDAALYCVQRAQEAIPQTLLEEHARPARETLEAAQQDAHNQLNDLRERQRELVETHALNRIRHRLTPSDPTA